MIGILDTGIGTVRSVENTFRLVSSRIAVSNDLKVLKSCSHLVIPGNGSFASAEPLVSALKAFDLVGRVGDGLNVLAICLGMQVLFERSSEAPQILGLGLFDGMVCSIKELASIPSGHHIGWSRIDSLGDLGGPSWMGDNGWVYFNHQFGVEYSNSSRVVSTCLNGRVIATIRLHNLVATQWHPECSGKQGLRFIRGFIENGSEEDNPFNSF
jgi:glutamine amidotransferase